MEVRLPVRPYLNGRLARVFTYERRINQRCPSADFLKGIEKAMRRRFDGQLDALSKDGGDIQYENQQRFHALHGDGKPLWEFKETTIGCTVRACNAARIASMSFCSLDG